MEGEDYDWHAAMDILTDVKNKEEKKNTSWLATCKTDVKKIKENLYSAADWHKYKSKESDILTED